MTKHYEANPPYVVADAGMVLFDGYGMTGVGGRVSSNDTTYLDTLLEMTEAEAQVLIDEATAEATEADYIAALGEMGVQLPDDQ